MDHLIYTAMNGAKQAMLRQASNNHNLANVNTTGFRADFDVAVSKPVYGPGNASRVYVEDTRVGVDFTPGPMIATGRDMDVAISGEGFLAIQGKDGTEAYTRAGDLRVSASGFLETGAGHLVMGNGGPISLPPHDKLEIAKDGTISIRPLGQSATSMATIDRLKLVNPPAQDLEKGLDGLLRLKDGGEATPDTQVQVTSGFLEGSNVNPINSLVTMIETSRQYEMHIKVLKAAEEADQASAQILSIS